MLCLRLTPLPVLVLVVSLGAAFPHEGTPGKGCSLFRYKQVIFQERHAVEEMQKAFRSNRRLNRNCNTSLLDRNWTSAHLSVPDRVLLVEAELNFTIAMLQLPARPSFAKTRQRLLHVLSTARKDLQGCVSAPQAPLPRASSAAPVLWQRRGASLVLTQPLSLQVSPSHQPSEELRQWLHNLQVAMGTVTQDSSSCLRDYAIRHLFEVLGDLNCAALQEKCA
ncbi:interferon lambda-3-like [Pithys albifrons albifrons]|uniref:interferon lambda-3-like n=1 Tax=Pithys albifrons albifrons TaxID=3385563 RepID=UPI003A5CD437